MPTSYRDILSTFEHTVENNPNIGLCYLIYVKISKCLKVNRVREHYTINQVSLYSYSSSKIAYYKIF